MKWHITRLFHIPEFATFVTLTLGTLWILDLFVNTVPLIPWMFIAFAVLKVAFNTKKELRDLLNKLTFLIYALVLGLMFTEILFRFCFLEPTVPRTDREFFKSIAASWPHSVTLKKNPRTVRILGLSDSFGRNGGLNNHHYILESLLQKSGYKIEVVNFSIDQLQPADELELFKRFGPRYHPDIVLHGFFVGNDFEIQTGTLMSYQNIPLLARPGLASFRPRNFLFPRWVYRCLLVWLDRMHRAWESLRDEPIGDFSRESFLNIERRRLEVSRLTPHPSLRWQETIKLLDEISKTVQQRGAKYILIIHPDQLQVDERLLDGLKQMYHMDLSQYDLAMPQKFLINYCTARNIRCLDLLPVLKAENRDRNLYSFRNTHYNKHGDLLVATAIGDFLRENIF